MAFEWETNDPVAQPWETDDPIVFGQDDPIDKSKGFMTGLLEKPEEKLPVLGTAIKTAKSIRVAGAFQRTSEGYDYSKPISPESPMPGAMGIKPALYTTKEKDIQDIEDYLIDLDKGYTTAGTAGRILSEMPAFVLDFLMTGGSFKVGSAAGKKAVGSLLGRLTATTAGKATIATGGFAIGTAARAAGMPHRAVDSILKRQIPKDMKISDGVVTGTPEKPITSLWKGLADHYIELGSEQAGEHIAPSISKFFKRLPLMGKLISTLQKRWLKLHPRKTISDFAKAIGTKTGFHGVLSEVGEEYLGDAARAITAVDDFGAGEDANWLERLSAGVRQDTENLPAMLLAFSVPGVGFKAVDVHVQKQIKKNREYKKNMDLITGMLINSPTQVETAEGTIGYEDDFFMEKWYQEQPKYEFDTPGMGKFFTPKWLLNRLLGTEILLEDVTKAEEAHQLERLHLNSWINKLLPKLRKEKGLTRLPEILTEEAIKEARQFPPGTVNVYKGVETGEVYPETPEGGEIRMEQTEEGTQIVSTRTGEVLELDEELSEAANREQQKGVDVSKAKAHILQKKIDSKKPMHIMRDLIDTYEDAPSFLNENETRIFNQIRELTRYLRQRANLVRERMGLQPISELKGYITHWMDRATNRVMNKDIPIHSGYLYFLMKGLPKEVKNPTAMKRKIKGDMEKYFSKDLGKLLRIMTAYDLKDIYLMEPYQAAWDELKDLRESRLIPDSTYNEVENFLLYDIRKHQAPMDKAFNQTIKKPIDLLNKILPVKSVIDDASRSVFTFVRRLGHISGLGFRLRPANRNLGQRLLLTDLYRTVDYAKAQAVAFRLAEMPNVKHPQTGESIPLIDLIREQDWYKLALRKFEDTVSTVTKVEKSSLYLYSKTHVGNLFLSNVEVAALTGYFDWESMYNQSKDVRSRHFKNAIKQSKKLDVPVVELLTGENDMMWNIREAVRRTQWEYFSTSMPAFYRSQFNRAMGQFQSWWMNYFFNHSREMINQSLTGRNSLGRLLTPGGRLRAAKGLGTIQAIGKASKTLFGIEMLKYLFFPLPGYLPPIPALIAGFIQFFAADDDRERKKAWKKIKYGLKFWIPFSAFGRDLNKLLSGEYSIGDFLFYKEKK